MLWTKSYRMHRPVYEPLMRVFTHSSKRRPTGNSYLHRVPRAIGASLHLISQWESMVSMRRKGIGSGAVLTQLIRSGFSQQVKWYHRGSKALCCEHDLVELAAFEGYIKLAEWLAREFHWSQRNGERCSIGIIWGYIRAGLITGLETPMAQTTISLYSYNRAKMISYSVTNRYTECVDWFHSKYREETERIAWGELITGDFGVWNWFVRSVGLTNEHTYNAAERGDVDILSALVKAGCPINIAECMSVTVNSEVIQYLVSLVP